MSTTHARRANHDSLSDVVHAGAQSVADAGTDLYHAAVDQSKEAGKQVDRYVRANPWYAIGAAAGVGFLAGIMLRRR